MTDYTLPTVWEWEDANTNIGGNRPTAGSRFKQKLPVGDASFQVYSLGTPNGVKVTIMLEELKEIGKTDVAYDLYQIHIGEGDQFGSDFVSISPNSKIPRWWITHKHHQLRYLNRVLYYYIRQKNLMLFTKKKSTRRQRCLTGCFGKLGQSFCRRRIWAFLPLCS